MSRTSWRLAPRASRRAAASSSAPASVRATASSAGSAAALRTAAEASWTGPLRRPAKASRELCRARAGEAGMGVGPGAAGHAPPEQDVGDFTRHEAKRAVFLRVEGEKNSRVRVVARAQGRGPARGRTTPAKNWVRRTASDTSPCETMWPLDSSSSLSESISSKLSLKELRRSTRAPVAPLEIRVVLASPRLHLTARRSRNARGSTRHGTITC